MLTKRSDVKTTIWKLINFLVVKSKKKIYMVPHNNGRGDKYDLINFSADNILTLLNYAKDSEDFKDCTFFVECYSEQRSEKIKEYVSAWKIRVVPILSDETEEHPNRNTRTRIRNFLIRYSCKTWISCTPFAGWNEKLKSQRFICLSYSTPLKSGTTLFQHDLRHLDNFLETSLLTASVHAAQYRNRLTECPIIGFPRNDRLFCDDKRQIIQQWIKTKTDVAYEKLIVYAPTYRDYENAYDDCSVLGFKNNSFELEQFLHDNNILLIAKFHPYQKLTTVKYTPHIIPYEKSYDFSLYDLLACSDMLISDYSSVIHDYIITGKPVVIDCFDYEKYEDSRGFAFEPVDYVLPGRVCGTFEELKAQITDELSRNTRQEKYYEVQKMFHKYIDNESSKRVLDFLKGCIYGR